jgi:hypothetical protein
MYQTAHDSAAGHVTGGDLESIWRHDLNVSYLVDRQSHLL